MNPGMNDTNTSRTAPSSMDVNTDATDPVARLAALRPDEQTLEADWTAPRRIAVLEQVLRECDADAVPGAAHEPGRHGAHPLPPPRSLPSPRSRVQNAFAAPKAARNALSTREHRDGWARRRRGAWVASGAVAAVVAALLLVPLLVPSGSTGGPPSADALEALATTAAAEIPLQPGQFRHIVATETQNGFPIERESWTNADGDVWRRDSIGDTTMYYAYQHTGKSLNDPSPTFLATLPTDPAVLNTYLRAHVTGSNSTSEAVFVAAGDLLRGGLASPALRAAMLRVLENTPHVTARTTNDDAGKAVVAVSFVDDATRPNEVQTLSFDPATARIVGEHTTAPGVTFTRTVSDTGVADAVPANLLRYGTEGGTCMTPSGPQPDLVCMQANRGAVTTSTQSAPASASTSSARTAAPTR